MKQASMERKILSYSISLALCLLMFLPLRAQNGNPTAPPQGAPPKKEKKDAKEEVHYPLYNGMRNVQRTDSIKTINQEP